MDVVKTQVEKIGGTVDLQSTEGRGTTVKIKIPLTLAIIPALLVKSGGERFAIAQVSLLEVVRLENSLGIERVHNAPVYRLRGRLLPLLDLSSELGLVPTRVFPSSDSASNLVVVQAHGCAFGILVDEILDSEEIVVKPLGPHLKRIVAYSGATIFGDGRVALILDIVGLAQNAGIVSEYGNESPRAETCQPQANSHEHPQSLLIVECGTGGRIAIPLSLVTRLEELPASSIELAGPLEVTQYHGQVLPLMRLSQVLYPANLQPEDPARDRILPVVVCSESGRSVGLIVDRIVDIVEHPQDLENPGRRLGVLGSSIIGSRITELIDVPALMRQGIYAAGNARAARGGV